MTTQTEANASSKDAALKLALEALEGFYEYGYDRRECFEHITAIKESLAKPEQRSNEHLEPVAWMEKDVLPLTHIIKAVVRREKDETYTEPLYTTTPQRKPLTDEEIMNIAKVSCIGISPHEDTLNFAKVIEAVHGIRSKT